MTGTPTPLPAKRLPEPTFASVRATALMRGERRMEGEAYLTGGYAVRLRIETCGAPFARVVEIADVWQPSRLKGVTVSPAHGVPFFTATQVFDVQPVIRKWIAPERTNELGRRYVEPGWILVTCSGNVGEASISYAPHKGIVLSHDILRVQVRKEAERGYLYCFLRSRLGRMMLQSSQYGSIIKHLEPEHLHLIPVPLVPESLKHRLHEAVNGVYAKREEAYRLLKQAEEMFEKKIGVPPGWAEEEERAFSVSGASLFGGTRRIDGYHYNPKARAVLAAVHKAQKPVEPLHSLVEGVFLPNRFVRTPAPGGLPYVDSEDIFKLNAPIVKFIWVNKKQSVSLYYVRGGWLLLCRSGQIYGICGRVMMADKRHEEKVFSEDLIRIVPKEGGVRPGYLQMALGHQLYGRPLVLRLAFGTQIPHIAPEDLEDFPVIRLGKGAESEIADMVEQASTLRAEGAEQENKVVAETERYLEEILWPGAMATRDGVVELPEAERLNPF